MSKKRQHFKQRMGKDAKKANKRKKRKERLPGLQLASSNSNVHPSYLDRRPALCFVLETKPSHYARHTERSAPKLDQ